MSLKLVIANKYLNLLNKSRVLAGKELLIGDKLRKFLILQLVTASVLAVIAYCVTDYIVKIPNTYSALVIAASVLAPIFAPLINYHLKAFSRAKKLELDFKYFVISEGVILDKKSELIRDLLEVGTWSDVFPDLYKEAIKLKKLSKVLSIFDSVKTYVKLIMSKEVGRALLDYLFSLSLGSGINWVKEKSDEWLNSVRLLAYSKVRLRTTVSIMLAILLGYTPPLVVMLSVIVGTSVMYKALLATLALSMFAFVLTPKLPRHLSTSVVDFKCRTYVITSATPITSALATYFILHSVKYALLTFSIVGLVCGVIKLREFISRVRELSDLPRILSIMSEAPLTIANPLEIFKKALRTSRAKVFKSLSTHIGKDLRASMKALRNSLWLSKYLTYIIIKGISSGTLSRERVLKLRELILDLIKDIKFTLMTNLLVAIISLVLPVILTSVSAIAATQVGYAVKKQVEMFSIASIIIYGMYAGYIVFDDPLNTLLCSASLLTYILSSRVLV